ncbi:TetR/AcrR family transcriptional regulator [Cellulomonas biazotea]|uniref:TetR family transcriptional regulator n=1 Tax=Cellulomonas biazotea TaxID=1709 RepID=A0A402DW91_9CELL|nr:TetR/AcrR family transcriptional regulator [Cellulomonas biazotea]GCE78388.1 TetR family transcriptional regulator [Cellulomonas biazotea]
MTDGTEGSRHRARSPRMARDERRAQVLHIAQGLFSSEGFHHVSMDDIADRAEVSKPVLYRHFPSKLDLYLAVVDQCGSDLLAAVEVAVAPLEAGPVHRGAGRDVIAAIVRAYIDFVDVAGESSTLLFESDVTHDDDVRARVEHASLEAARRISAVLAQVTGLAPAASDTLAVSLIAMAQGAATHRLRSTPVADAGLTAELVTQLAWGGVAGLVRPDFVYEEA